MGRSRRTLEEGREAVEKEKRRVKKIKESTLGMANEELVAEEEIKSRIVRAKQGRKR